MTTNRAPLAGPRPSRKPAEAATPIGPMGAADLWPFSAQCRPGSPGPACQVPSTYIAHTVKLSRLQPRYLEIVIGDNRAPPASVVCPAFVFACPPSLLDCLALLYTVSGFCTVVYLPSSYYPTVSSDEAISRHGPPIQT